MKTRLYRQSDLDSILELFYHNIHTVCVHDYTLEQLDAWAPANPDVYRWQVSLNRNHTLVVEKDSQIIGFGDVGETGYLDRLYVHPDIKALLHCLLNNWKNMPKPKEYLL